MSSGPLGGRRANRAEHGEGLPAGGGGGRKRGNGRWAFSGQEGFHEEGEDDAGGRGTAPRRGDNFDAGAERAATAGRSLDTRVRLIVIRWFASEVGGSPDSGT